MEGKETKSGKNLTWVVFYGLSALGKTHFLKTFFEICAAEQVHCQIVSSDDSSKAAMDAEMEKDPTLTRKSSYDKTRKESTIIFEKSIQKAVEELKDGYNIIVLDKVINSTEFLKNINSQFNVTCPTRLVALIPWSPHAFNYSESGLVPFSDLLLINICYRILKRTHHQTVEGPDAKKLKIALSFVKLYDDLIHPSHKQGEEVVEKFYEIPFHEEKGEGGKMLPTRLVEVLKRTLSELKAFQEDNSVCQELVDVLNDAEIKKLAEPLLYYGPDEQQIAVVKKLIASSKEMKLSN